MHLFSDFPKLFLQRLYFLLCVVTVKCQFFSLC